MVQDRQTWRRDKRSSDRSSGFHLGMKMDREEPRNVGRLKKTERQGNAFSP